MIASLLKEIKERAAMIPALQDAEIRIAPNPRFDGLVEGKLNVVVTPFSVHYEYDARDVVKETTVVAIAVAEYFADKFDDDDVYGLLKIIPEIEQAFSGLDIKIGSALYRWESIIAQGQPRNDTLKDVEGGILDVDAADNAYIYQAPMYIGYARYLKSDRPRSVTLVAPVNEPAPEEIVAPESMRMSLRVYQGGEDITTKIYRAGILRFATL